MRVYYQLPTSNASFSISQVSFRGVTVVGSHGSQRYLNVCMAIVASPAVQTSANAVIFEAGSHPFSFKLCLLTKLFSSFY